MRHVREKFTLQATRFQHPPLEAFALSDVADRARDERALLRLQRAQADFNRELRAILTQSKELEARSHGARVRLHEIAGSMLRMRATKAQRHEQFHPLADQLLPSVAKELFRLCIDQED